VEECLLSCSLGGFRRCFRSPKPRIFRRGLQKPSQGHRMQVYRQVPIAYLVPSPSTTPGSALPPETRRLERHRVCALHRAMWQVLEGHHVLLGRSIPCCRATPVAMYPSPSQNNFFFYQALLGLLVCLELVGRMKVVSAPRRHTTTATKLSTCAILRFSQGAFERLLFTEL
jgi:hypothetical protein